MAYYQTGTATDPGDLLYRIRDFMGANGWSIVADLAEGTGLRVCMSKSGQYAIFRSCTAETNIWYGTTGAGTGINLVMATAYSPATAWNDQVGVPLASGTAYPTGCAIALPPGAVTAYHLFCDAGGDNFTIVAEKSAVIYTALSFGLALEKAGAWTGGAYMAGSALAQDLAGALGGGTARPGYAQTCLCPFTNGDTTGSGYPLGYVQAEVDTWTGGLWIGIGTGTNNQRGYTGWLGLSNLHYNTTTSTGEIPYGQKLQPYCFSALNQQAIFLPVALYAARSTGGWSLLGTVPGLFYSGAYAGGYNPGSVLSIGGDDYMVFPNFVVKKN